MSWTEKSKEIAVEVLDKMEKGAQNSYTRDDVLNGLREAAMQGMVYECNIAVMPLLNKINKNKEYET